MHKYDGKIDFGLSWYQDKETIMLIDGKNQIYDIIRLNRMYTYFYYGNFLGTKNLMIMYAVAIIFISLIGLVVMKKLNLNDIDKK